MKFSTSGGRRSSVRCRVEEGTKAGPARKFVCEVLETGPGLRVGEDKTIFEKFKRGRVGDDQVAPDPRTTTGLHLGLYITKSIVERLNGTVTPGNRTDGERGARFLIEVPEASLPKSDAPAPVRQLVPGDGPIRLLLVDDEMSFVNEVAARLRRHSPRISVDVTHASTCVPDLWSQNRRQGFNPPYHLIALDYELADTSGPAVARSLRNNHGLNDRTLLVCMTAALTQDRKWTARDAGFAETIQKTGSIADDLIAFVEGQASRRDRTITPGGATSVVITADKLATISGSPRDVSDLKDMVARLRSQYRDKCWRELQDTAHFLGGRVLFRYGLAEITLEIQEGAAPTVESPKDPARAESGILRLEELVLRLESQTPASDGQ